MQKIKTTRETSGFSLPAVLILSLTILAMCLALLQTASTVRIDVQGRYYTTLAEEAAEAGANYASTCLALSDHVQTWGVGAFGGDKPNLKPSTDCNGASTYPSITSVYSDSHIETTFDVGQLDTSLPSGAQISSTGTTKIKNTTNGTVIRTYTHIMKKTITWDPNFTSEKSTSGTTRTCGILTGSVYCWGTNAYGQLGNGTHGGGSPSVNASTTPVKVVRDTYPTGIGTKKVIDMSSGGYFNCIIIEGGEVYCWGQNNNGQLGIGSTTPSFSSVPVKVTGLAGKTIVKLGVSANTACALKYYKPPADSSACQRWRSRDKSRQ